MSTEMENNNPPTDENDTDDEIYTQATWNSDPNEATKGQLEILQIIGTDSLKQIDIAAQTDLNEHWVGSILRAGVNAGDLTRERHGRPYHYRVTEQGMDVFGELVEPDHDSDSPYVCRICNKGFPRPKEARHHLRNASDPRHKGRDTDFWVIESNGDEPPQPDRYDGEETTEGADEIFTRQVGNRSYTGPAVDLTGIDKPPQTIQDRPHSDDVPADDEPSATAPDETESRETPRAPSQRILVEINEDHLFELLTRGFVSRELKQDLFDQIRGQ